MADRLKDDPWLPPPSGGAHLIYARPGGDVRNRKWSLLGCAGLYRAEIEALKAFLTRQDDGGVRLTWRRNPRTRCHGAPSSSAPPTMTSAFRTILPGSAGSLPCPSTTGATCSRTFNPSVPSYGPRHSLGGAKAARPQHCHGR